MNAFIHDADILFQRAFRHAAIGMAIADPAGNFLSVNPELCRMLGYTEKELTRMNDADITHPADVAASERARLGLLGGAGETFDCEKRYIRSDGRHIWVRLTSTLVRNGDGTPRYFIAQMQDLSPRKRVEHQLEYIMQQYRTLFDKNPDIVYVMSPDGEITSMNAVVGDITGYSAQEWAERPPEAIAQLIRRSLERAEEGAYEPIRAEAEVAAKDGGLVHLDVTHVPIVIDGEAAGVFGIAKNVTEQVRLLTEWKDKESKYRLLAEHSLDMIAAVNAFGVFTYVSPSAAAVLGYMPEDLVGVRALSIVHPDDAADLKRTLREAFGRADSETDEIRSVVRARRKDGRHIRVEAVTRGARRSVRTGRVTEFVTVVRDIGEREEARQRLRLAEERFRALAGASGDLVVVADGGGVIRYVAPSLKTLIGCEPEEWIGTKFEQHFHPEDVSAVRAVPLRDEMLCSCRVRRNDGGYATVFSSLKFLRDDLGRVREILGVMRVPASLREERREELSYRA